MGESEPLPTERKGVPMDLCPREVDPFASYLEPYPGRTGDEGAEQTTPCWPDEVRLEEVGLEPWWLLIDHLATAAILDDAGRRHGLPPRIAALLGRNPMTP